MYMISSNGTGHLLYSRLLCRVPQESGGLGQVHRHRKVKSTPDVWNNRVCLGERNGESERGLSCRSLTHERQIYLVSKGTKLR